MKIIQKLLPVLLIFSLILFAAQLFAQNSQNCTLIGHWADGPCFAVDVVGTTAYFGNGAYFQIADFSDPANPVELVKFRTPEIVRSVAVSGDYAYVANENAGMRVINISDPGNLFEVGFINVSYKAYDIAIIGNYAYLADKSYGLRVIDISVPTNPVEVAFFSDDKSIGLAASGDFVYMADGHDGLRIIDVSEPSNPVEVDTVEIYYVYNVAVSGDYVYAAASDSLVIVDISTPTNPNIVKSFVNNGSMVGVTVSSGIAYVVDMYMGLYIVDVSTPTNPMEMSHLDYDGRAYDILVKDDYAYVADQSGGLKVFDVSIPSAPTMSGVFDTGAGVYGVTVRGNYAYLAERQDGLRVLDISDPFGPIAVGNFDSGDFAAKVTLNGNYAYIADRLRDLRIIDISTPSNPVEVGFFEMSGESWDVVVKDDIAYLAQRTKGLRLIDVSDPSSPSEIGFLDTEGSAWGLDVTGNYAYVADGDYGLRIIDISNPANPSETGFFDTGGDATNVTISGNYAYVADKYPGIRVIDISDPVNPSEVGFFNSQRAYNVVVRNDFAYIADYGGGLRVVNISDPTNPFEAGFYYTGDRAVSLTVDENYIYVADNEAGLYIIHFAQGSTCPPIFPETGIEQEVGTEFWVDVNVGTEEKPVSDLFGVSFNFRFTNTEYIDVVSPTSANVEAGSFLGSDVVFYSSVNDADGIVSAGISRKAGQGGVNGLGTVLRVKLIASSDTPDGTQVEFSPTNIIANDAEGSSMSLCPEPLIVTITTGENPVLSVDKTTLDFGTEQNNVTFQISNSGSGTLNWSVAENPDKPWITSVSPSSGSGDATVTVNVDRTYLTSESDTGLLQITSNGGTENITVIISAEELYPAIIPQTNTIQKADSSFWVDIIVGDEAAPVSDLFGIAFDFNFTNTEYIDVVAPASSSLIPGDFLGDDVIFYTSVDETGGTISVGISRKQGQGGISGQGIILRALFIASGETPNDTPIQFSVSNLTANDPSGSPITLSLGTLTITIQTATYVHQKETSLPGQFYLKQNYPNPFNAETIIEYEVREPTKVVLKVFDLNGREVMQLVDDFCQSGLHQVKFGASGLASGVYFYRIEMGDFKAVKKMVLLE